MVLGAVTVGWDSKEEKQTGWLPIVRFPVDHIPGAAHCDTHMVHMVRLSMGNGHMSADSRDPFAFPNIHIPHIPLQILNISGILQESGQMPDHLILILCIHVQVDHPIIQNLFHSHILKSPLYFIKY